MHVYQARDGHVAIHGPAGAWIACAPLAAAFPAWRQVIPSDTIHTATVSGDALAKALAPHVAAVKGAPVNPATRLHVNGRLAISTTTDGGSAASECECAHAGPDVEASYSARLLASVVNCAGGGTLTLRWTADVMFQPLMVEGDDGVRAVLMPMRPSP